MAAPYSVEVLVFNGSEYEDWDEGQEPKRLNRPIVLWKRTEPAWHKALPFDSFAGSTVAVDDRPLAPYEYVSTGDPLDYRVGGSGWGNLRKA